MPGTNFWGTLICQLRAEQNLSQRELATKANVNRSTLRRIEREGGGDIGIIETVLLVLGYELDAESVESKQDVNRRRIEETENPSARSRLAKTGILLTRF